MKEERNEITLRVPNDLWLTYKKAAMYSKQSMNKVVCEALDARKTFIEKKYIPSVDRSK